MSEHDDQNPYHRRLSALFRLARWKTVFAGWQLGTRPLGDPESDAVRDHREATLMLRVEASALAQLLIDKGVFTKEEWCDALETEANNLNDALEIRFPGFSAIADGLAINAEQAQETMRGWKP